MKNKQLLGNILLTVTALIWGTAFVAQRVGMDKIEPITFNAARMALAALAVGLVAFLLYRKDLRDSHSKEPQRKNLNENRSSFFVRTSHAQDSLERLSAFRKSAKNDLIGGICCGFFLSLASIFQQMGLVYATAGKAGFITAMYILLVPIINFFLFRKKNTWTCWLAVGVGVIGMYLLCGASGLSLEKGDDYLCICALLYSGQILCVDHFAKNGNPVRLSAIQFATATVISTVGALLLEEPTLEKILSASFPILYCGLMSGGIAYTLQIVAQGFTDPTIASLLMSLESVFAAISGAIILNERMSPRELAGSVIMFAAIVLVQVPVPKIGMKQESAP